MINHLLHASWMTPQLRAHLARMNPGMYSNFSTSRNSTASSVAPPPTSSGGAANLGTLNYNPNANRNYTAANLPRYNKPDDALARGATRQHEFMVREFRPFEQALIDTVNDTSLIDAVPEDVERQSRIAREIDERNRSRYGYERTAVEKREVEREAQRTEAIGLAGGLNNARLAQRSRNQDLLAGLVNIGQGINRESLSQMGSAADSAVQRRNAYLSDKAQAKAQRWGFLGML